MKAVTIDGYWFDRHRERPKARLGDVCRMGEPNPGYGVLVHVEEADGMWVAYYLGALGRSEANAGVPPLEVQRQVTAAKKTIQKHHSRGGFTKL